MVKETLAKIRDARAVSTPLLGITTADPMAAVLALVDEYDPKLNARVKTDTPILAWDMVRGYQAANEAGRSALASMMPPPDPILGPGVDPSTNPVEALKMAYNAPAGCFIAFLNAQRLLESGPFVQGVCNLRDAFKGSRRTALLIGPSFQLPIELAQDVLMLDDPLPTIAELADLVQAEADAFGKSSIAGPTWTAPTPAEVQAAAASLTGLARFPAEQTTATMFRTAKRIDRAIIWDRKRSYIGQTPGLTAETVRETLADVRGLDALTAKLRRRMTGKDSPVVLVRLEELEKLLGGAKSDSSGTSQDALAVLLTAMEETDWEGLIAFGAPGTGKSLLPRALAGEYSTPILTYDMGGMKGSLVGQSEQYVRAAVKTIKAIAGPRAYFLASCNGTATIPAALIRRFTDGIWYFDLPTAEALAGSWVLYRAKYEIDPADVTPNCNGWTPAEVRNCCRTAYREGLTLREASRFVVPVSRSDRAGLAAMRQQAQGAFLDATTGETYSEGAVPAAAVADRLYGEDS